MNFIVQNQFAKKLLWTVFCCSFSFAYAHSNSESLFQKESLQKVIAQKGVEDEKIASLIAKVEEYMQKKELTLYEATEINYLGTKYLMGDGVKQDFIKAIRCFRKTAEQGEADGQLMLASCYMYGTGVEKNSTEAVKWYRKAAEYDKRAQYELGLCYETGIGVKKNFDNAAKWYQKAAEEDEDDLEYEKGYVPAMERLGWAYTAGRGVPKDDVQALHWLKKVLLLVSDDPAISDELITSIDDIEKMVNLLEKIATGQKKK